MPFASIGELPPTVRERLTEQEQRVWLRVFNRVFRETDGDDSAKEAAAFRAANGAVTKKQAFTGRVEFAKVDEEKRIVWGWAYVCEELGSQVVDHSGDIVEAAEIEKAAHGFMLDSRQGGVMHETKAGLIVDSVFFSKDVQGALGINLGKVGWWIGYKVLDDEVWKRVKSGELSAFSIGGSSETEEVTDAA